jgi:hypothetical protein
MSVIENVTMFIYIIMLDASNREIQERFQHLKNIINRCLNKILKTICLFAIDIIKLEDS